MFNYFWPIALVVGANTLYNITAKSTPANVNSFASLAVTYIAASVLSVIMFFLTSQNKNLAAELKNVNWTALTFSAAIVALEFGYINIYRVGWKVSTGSLVANISLACVLLLVGVLFYKEALSVKQIIGIILCAAGFILIGK